MSDGSIRNAYDLRLRNMYSEDRLFEVSLTAEDVLQASLEGTEMLSVWVPADSSFMQRVYVTARPNSQAANRDRTEFRFWVEDQLSGDRTFGDTVFNGRVTQ
jgi:hypothetical protein